MQIFGRLKVQKNGITPPDLLSGGGRDGKKSAGGRKGRTRKNKQMARGTCLLSVEEIYQNCYAKPRPLEPVVRIVTLNQDRWNRL